MKWFKRIIIGTIAIILGLITLFNVYNLIEVKILKKDLATVGGYGLLEVVSGSMEPTINVGDIIVINKFDKNYHEKDIVTFYDEDNSFVTHRIVALEKDKMITKGDNNDSLDKVTNIDKIVGKYVFKINKAGIIISSLKSPFTLVMIFIIGLIICIIFSTDNKGNIILDEEEKEFQEFLKNKENSKNKKGNKKK